MIINLNWQKEKQPVNENNLNPTKPKAWSFKYLKFMLKTVL